METSSNGGTAVAKRTRRSGKRVRFRSLPRPAYPVRGLWEAATAEEKQRAHRTCVAILEWWLGRKGREQVATELGVPGLRVWQLSQGALSGMLAGLLKQPRRRGRSAMRTVLDEKQQDTAALRKENAELKRRLEIAERLIRLLREMPEEGERTASPTPEAGTPATSRRRGEKRKTARSRGESSRDDPCAGAGVPAPR
jgi:hypothetical protein